jgi:hypothetical protein
MSHAGLAKEAQRRLENAEGGSDVVAVGSSDGVFSPRVGAKQLVGPIEQVETHEHDPTSDEPIDPWTTFQEEFHELGDQLKDTYRKVASDGGPSDEEIKDAFGTLASAWGQVAGSVSSALQDPEVRQRLKDAGSAFAAAVGRTISDLGDELRDKDSWRPTSPDDNDEEE